MSYPDFIKLTKFTFNFNKKCEQPMCNHNRLVQCHPEMQEIDSWNTYRGKNQEEILVYIMLLYDRKAYMQGTPLQQKYTDIQKRREMAVTESGISEEDFAKIKEGDKVYMKMILDFLKYQNSRLWSLIVATENSFLEYLDTLMSKQTAFNNDKDLISAIANKEKVREFLSKVVDDLDRLYDKFYNGDKEIEEVANKRIKLSPESLANRLK